MASSNDENRPGRRSKSADAFRTISEVSDDVGVPQHVLRFWETKFSQIKPLKRGGGRRYYRPEDIDLLRRIKVWLYDDGYTIKGVQKLLKEGGAALTAPTGRPPSQDEGREADSGRASPAAEGREDRRRPLQILRPHDAEDERDEDRPGYDRAAAVERTVERTVAGDDVGPGGPGSVDAEAEASPSAAAAENAGRVAAEKAAPARAAVDDPTDDAPLRKGAPPAFGGREKAGLDSAIESLEDIRDRLRGPPPDP